MAYVFEPDQKLGDESYLIDNLGTEIVEFALGYNPETLSVTLMSVMFVPTGEGVCDIRFGIRERHGEHRWKVSAPDYTREKVAACIPAHARGNISAMIEEAVGILAKGTKFTEMTMETYYQNLPDKALGKYECICKPLKSNGFAVKDQFRAEDGTNYWFFSKPN